MSNMTFSIVLTFLMACGSNQSGQLRRSADGTTNSKVDDANVEVKPVSGTLAWSLLPCGSEPKNSSGIEGAGVHKVSILDPSNFKLQLEGRFCKSEELGRRIVLLVDVSSNSTDSSSGSACQRHSSLLETIMSLSNYQKMQFALITFNYSVVYQSQGFTDASSFLSQVVTPSRICANFGSARLDLPFSAAADMLGRGEPGVSDEVLLLSRVVPTISLEQGLNEAKQLKEKALLLTSYIGASSDVLLRDVIASKDADGRPLHQSVRRLPELSQSLKNLTRSEMKAGQVIYRAIGDSMTGVRVKLSPDAGQKPFTIKYLEEFYTSGHEGIEVLIEYWDQRTALFQSKGSILWQ